MNRSNYPPDWEQRRRRVFKRDEFQCRGCGETPSDGRMTLHCHHKNPISEGGGHSLDNLIAVCEDCHNQIHSVEQSPPLEPVEFFPCSTCDGQYREGHSVHGSFCSERCYVKHKARKALNHVENDGQICNTCYANFPTQCDVCPNCDNWDPQQDNSEALDDVQTDELNLVAALIKKNNLQ